VCHGRVGRACVSGGLSKNSGPWEIRRPIDTGKSTCPCHPILPQTVGASPCARLAEPWHTVMPPSSRIASLRFDCEIDLLVLGSAVALAAGNTVGDDDSIRSLGGPDAQFSPVDAQDLRCLVRGYRSSPMTYRRRRCRDDRGHRLSDKRTRSFPISYSGLGLRPIREQELTRARTLRLACPRPRETP